MNAITKENFKKAYEEAKAGHLMSFKFNGEEFSLGYASYLLTYQYPREEALKKQQNETSTG